MYCIFTLLFLIIITSIGICYYCENGGHHQCRWLHAEFNGTTGKRAQQHQNNVIIKRPTFDHYALLGNLSYYQHSFLIRFIGLLCYSSYQLFALILCVKNIVFIKYVDSGTRCEWSRCENERTEWIGTGISRTESSFHVINIKINSWLQILYELVYYFQVRLRPRRAPPSLHGGSEPPKTGNNKHLHAFSIIYLMRHARFLYSFIVSLIY